MACLPRFILKKPWHWNKWTVNARLSYAWTKSTVQNADAGQEATLGKQLVYVPLHQAAGSVQVTYKNIDLRYVHNFTGARETTRDNNPNEQLPSFQTGQLILKYNQKIGKMRSALQFVVNNLWGSDYQVIAFRPMPGRNFEVGVVVLVGD